jgi:murein DD-endopeptidase MepM/ murein hydrolase activator NlpD
MRRGLCVCAALAALLFPVAAQAHTDAGWQLSLSEPAFGTVTSPFGRDGSRWHPGLDIGMLRSLDVRAAAGGVVTQVGYAAGFDGYGNIVLVRHRDGFETLYAHLLRVIAHVGQRVWSGEEVGLAGCTGWCTGTHLHFELRYRGVAMDPSLLLVN